MKPSEYSKQATRLDFPSVASDAPPTALQAYSFVLKFKRSAEHFNRLKKAITEWFADDTHYFCRNEADPTAPGYFLVKATAQEIPSDPFSLLIGDVVQNMRSSLDHLAFALASRFTNPLPNKLARWSQFPIVGDSDPAGNKGQGARQFKAVAHQIAGIDPYAMNLIQTVQPYHRGDKFALHPLWRLHELSNVDKHRTVHLGVIASTAMTVGRKQSRNADFRSHKIELMPFGPIGNDTLVARFHATPIDPTQEMDVHIRPLPGIVLTEGVASGSEIMTCLDEIGFYIQSVVFPRFYSLF